MEPTVYRDLATPLSGTSSVVDSGKLRKLYLQASFQQWFPPEKLDFTTPVEGDPRVLEVWRRFATVFYSLEKMGLGVLDHMLGKAVTKLKTDDAAFYLSTQVADEARHVFLVENYLRKLGQPPRFERRYAVFGRVASLGAYRVENWLFSTLFSESFASAFLRHAKEAEIDDFGREMCGRILSDEHRHLHFLHIVLPDLAESLPLLGRAYVKASQYFILKLTERLSASLAEGGRIIGIRREELLEEVFENVRKSYDALGVGRDFLAFPRIRWA